VALLLKGIISSLLFAYTVYTCGVTLPVIFGFFRDKLKITGNGALAAVIGGGGLGLFSKLAPYIDDWFNLDGTLASIKNLELWALLASVVLLFLVSYVDRRVRK
jgi:hypothetical protein